MSKLAYLIENDDSYGIKQYLRNRMNAILSESYNGILYEGTSEEEVVAELKANSRGGRFTYSEDDNVATSVFSTKKTAEAYMDWLDENDFEDSYEIELKPKNKSDEIPASFDDVDSSFDGTIVVTVPFELDESSVGGGDDDDCDEEIDEEDYEEEEGDEILSEDGAHLMLYRMRKVKGKRVRIKVKVRKAGLSRVSKRSKAEFSKAATVGWRNHRKSYTRPSALKSRGVTRRLNKKLLASS